VFRSRPPAAERARLALFPSTYRNPDGTVALTHQWFYCRFRPWVADLDLGRCVPHQARHTLATSLQVSRIASDASFGSSRGHALPAAQRAGLRRTRRGGAAAAPVTWDVSSRLHPMLECAI
jgi:integrase